jgi:predicted dithiol-disulfide oxidoreductase (DUF899 family)
MVSRRAAKIEAFKKRMDEISVGIVVRASSTLIMEFPCRRTRWEGACLQLRPNQVSERRAAGLSVFYKNGKGEVFHTYSMYARGLEDLLGVYVILDRVPKGRDEMGLPHGMAWVRHHDRYPESNIVEVKSAKG